MWLDYSVGIRVTLECFASMKGERKYICFSLMLEAPIVYHIHNYNGTTIVVYHQLCVPPQLFPLDWLQVVHKQV